MAHRFFVSPDSIRAGVVRLSEAQAHQLRDVLRMGRGAEIVVLDNLGQEYRVVLEEVARNGAEGKVLEQRAARGEPETQIFLYQALVKADKMEWALQKGTELGIAGFIPVVSERSLPDVGKSKPARWAHILQEAAEQAGRGKIPTLSPHQPLLRAMSGAQAQGGLILVPWEREEKTSLRTVLERSPARVIQLFIGPEGGFSEQEIREAQALGAQTVTLGPRILRAETAGLVAASAVLYANGDLSRA